MEAIRSSETSGTTQRTTRRHIPEEDTLQNHRRENLKSYMIAKSCLLESLFLSECNKLAYTRLWAHLDRNSLYIYQGETYSEKRNILCPVQFSRKPYSFRDN
jgi:hypothetical protein